MDLETFRHEKYLSARSSAADKMMNIADAKIGINPMDVITFLTDSPIFEKRNIDFFPTAKIELYYLSIF